MRRCRPEVSLPEHDNIDEASHVPPVHTKTWFHTGVYLGRDHVSDFFAGYWTDRAMASITVSRPCAGMTFMTRPPRRCCCLTPSYPTA